MNINYKTLYGGLAALQRELRKEEWQGARYVILLDGNTYRHCLPRLVGRVEALREADFVEVPVGDECKSMEVATQVWLMLLESGADRDTVLVDLGGGAVCDLGGYLAAGYHRGIRHINIPTTLLAMVDAAIGGKTAVNLGGVKNAVGHFYPAALTVVEPDFLDTLPDSELVGGIMEMVKTAAVCDPALYARLLSATHPVGRRAIQTAARLKTRVVKADPFDHGIRHILNFGHTFGHAVEIHCHLSHGLAVGVGMKAAMYLSVKKLGLAEAVYTSYARWLDAELASIGQTLPAPGLNDIEQMLPLMHRDKKNSGGELRCVLLQALGAAVIDVAVSDNEVRDALLHIARL